MRIIEANFEEIKDISRIYALSWKIAYRKMVPDSYLDTLKEDAWILPFQAWWEEGNTHFHICMDEDRPVAAAIWFLSKEENYKGWGELQSIYVLPEYSRKQCGKLLMEEIERQMRQHGVKNYYLWVLRENENAKLFYRKMGFQPTEDVLVVEIEGTPFTDYRWVKKISESNEG